MACFAQPNVKQGEIEDLGIMSEACECEAPVTPDIKALPAKCLSSGTAEVCHRLLFLERKEDLVGRLQRATASSG